MFWKNQKWISLADDFNMDLLKQNIDEATELILRGLDLTPREPPLHAGMQQPSRDAFAPAMRNDDDEGLCHIEELLLRHTEDNVLVVRDVRLGSVRQN